MHVSNVLTKGESISESKQFFTILHVSNFGTKGQRRIHISHVFRIVGLQGRFQNAGHTRLDDLLCSFDSINWQNFLRKFLGPVPS